MNCLKDFLFLGGVHHVCVIQQGEVTGSTFPPMLTDNVGVAARMMEQMLNSSQVLEEAHDEVHISMDDHQLIGVRISDDTLFILMADLDINLALISTAIRTSRTALLALRPAKEAPSSSTAPTASPKKPTAPTRATSAEREALKPVLKKVAIVLADYVGPAALVLFQRTHAAWIKEGPANRKRLPSLTNKMASFIDNTDKRAQFLLRTSDLISQTAHTGTPL